jgi:hypothetical protein
MPNNTAFPQWAMKVLTDDGFFQPIWKNFLQNLWERMGAGAGGGAVSPGGIVFNAATDTPPGWFLANGQAVNRQQNADLFKAIQTTYGPGDGSTTFNLPTVPDYNGFKAIIRS